MKPIKILHITDLHINDVFSETEKLRSGFFREFIDGLVDEIKKSHTTIDYLVLTGDFVNNGKLENFDHAHIVIEHLRKKLGLEKHQLALCSGNHDYDRKLDDEGNTAAARAPFIDISNEYVFGGVIASGEFYKLSKNESEVFLLSLDSTLGKKARYGPSTLSTREIDDVVTSVCDHVPDDCPLIVISHYPMLIFTRAQYIAEEENWIETHLWKSGTKITERIIKRRSNAQTFWFFGDGHVPDFCTIEEKHHFLLTGMLGGNFTNPTYRNSGGDIVPYNKTNEAKVISFDDNNQISIDTFSYRSKGHTYDPHLGHWEMVSSQPRHVTPTKVSSVDSSAKNNSLNEAIDFITEVIGSSVEQEIMEQIRTRELYRFGRFLTSADKVSLAWVSINKLFESKELLSRCIEKAVEWVDKKIVKENPSMIFIGLDFWGSILATQASVRKNAKNFCIATKFNGRHHTALETVGALCEKLKGIDNIQYIVLLTDVVSTGATVLNVKKAIQEATNQDLKWIVISIISDMKQKRNEEFNNFMAIGTFCGNLRIPILDISDLPDEVIFPNKYSLV